MPSPARLLAVAALLMVTCLSVPVPAGAGDRAAPAPAGIGIKLIEGPTNRRDDPRARVYIVDHLAPGATIRRKMSVENNTGTARHVVVYAEGASVGDRGFAFHSGREPGELAKWISVAPGSLDLPAGGKATVTASIAVPALASAGERYAVIWAENPASAESAGVGLSSRAGVRVYLDVGPGGEPPSDFEIQTLTPGRDPDGRPKIIAAVRNTGRRALDLGGTLDLSDGPGSLKAGPFSVELGTTLGIGHTGTVRVYLDKRLPEGPWTAQLTLRSGMVERTVSVTLTFPKQGMGAPVKPQAVSWFGTPLLVGLAAGVLLIVPILLVIRARAGRRDRVG